MIHSRPARRQFRAELAAEQDGLCAYCDVPMTDAGTYAATLERIISETDGGTYEPANCVAACWRCNRAKANFTPAELRQMADRIEALMVERGLSIGVPS